MPNLDIGNNVEVVFDERSGLGERLVAGGILFGFAVGAVAVMGTATAIEAGSNAVSKIRSFHPIDFVKEVALIPSRGLPGDIS